MAWWPTISSPSDWFFSLYSTQENQFSIYLIIVIMFWIHLQKKHGNLKRLIKMLQKIYIKIQNILIHDCVVIPAVDVKVASVRKKKHKRL